MWSPLSQSILQWSPSRLPITIPLSRVLKVINALSTSLESVLLEKLKMMFLWELTRPQLVQTRSRSQVVVTSILVSWSRRWEEKDLS
jgi:hypothetical protein